MRDDVDIMVARQCGVDALRELGVLKIRIEYNGLYEWCIGAYVKDIVYGDWSLTASYQLFIVGF